MEWMKECNPKDLKKPHLFMNDAAGGKLVEYYLCCALLLRPQEVDAIGADNEKLLKLAEAVATNDVEPVLDGARELALAYDENVHRKIEELTVWHEVDVDLFWHHSFLQVATEPYGEYEELVQQTIADWDLPTQIPDENASVEKVESFIREHCPEEVPQLAENVFSSWLDKSGMPVRGTVRNVLLDFGLIYGVDKAWDGVKLADFSRGKVHENAKETEL